MFIIPEGYSAVLSSTNKNHVVNGPPRATNVNCIFVFAVVTHPLKEQIERLCGCKISKYNERSRCSERNSGNTE